MCLISLTLGVQIAFVNFDLPPKDMGTAMKPQQMVDLLEEHIVGQVAALGTSTIISYGWSVECKNSRGLS